MARARPDTASRSGQLNVRIEPDHAEMLETMQYLYGITPPDLVRSLLSKELIRLRAEDDSFNDAVRTRREARAKQRGDVVRLPRTVEAS